MPPSSDHAAAAASPDAQEAHWADLTIPLDDLVAWAPRWMLYVAAATLLPHVLLWGGPAWPGLAALPGALVQGLAEGLLFLLVYAVSVFVHEGLHVLGMLLFARVPLATVRFRLRLREGIAYVHTAQPMTARAYRGVLVLPSVVLGLAPVLAGLALGSGWLTFYGFVMLASGVGDVAVLRLLQPVPGGTLVRDHPKEVGCLVRRPAMPTPRGTSGR